MTNEELDYLQSIESRLTQCEKYNHILLQSIRTLTDAYNSLSSDAACFASNYKYELFDPRMKQSAFFFPKIASYEETLAEIIQNKKSLVRFGDGEFAAISGNLRAKFTSHYNAQLAKRLTEVLHSNTPDILVAIADNYGNLDRYTEQSIREIRHYMTPEIRSQHAALLDADRTYYNAYITRPYILYRDLQTDAPARRFAGLKEIWEQKDCIIIEGSQSRLGIGNDLFSNSRSIKRILAPAVDAFECYEDILAAALTLPKDALYLIALGPAATVLAYDLAKEGRWALDIGHVDLEYEWFLKGTGRREAIPTKFNNEYPNGEIVEDISDETYSSQILFDFS